MGLQELIRSGLTRRQAIQIAAAAPAAAGAALRTASLVQATALAATAVSSFGTTPASNIIDGNDTTNWSNASGSSGIGWCTVQLTTSELVVSYSITGEGNEAGGNQTYSPKNWTLKGSTDNATWTIIDTQIDEVFALNQIKAYQTTAIVPYSYYKLDITASNGSAYVGLTEMRFYKAGAVPSSSVGDMLTFNKGLWVSTVNTNTTTPGINADWTKMVQGV